VVREVNSLPNVEVEAYIEKVQTVEAIAANIWDCGPDEGVIEQNIGPNSIMEWKGTCRPHFHIPRASDSNRSPWTLKDDIV
jgi:hypothetical protein